LAKLFLVESHPKRVDSQGRHIEGRTYVYYQDTSLKGLKATWAVEKQREIPKGNLESLLASGEHTKIMFL
jgi:hypothetical protein